MDPDRHHQAAPSPAAPAARPSSAVEAAAAVATVWNGAGLNYAVLHGVERYPAAIGRDLDVLMSARDADRGLELARAALEKFGYRVVFPPPLWGKRLIAIRGDDWTDCLEIHTLAAVSWRSLQLARTASPSEKIGPFPIDPWGSFAKRVLLPLLASGSATSKDPRKYQLTENERHAAEARLPKLAGKQAAADFLSALQTHSADRIEGAIPRLRSTLLRRCWLKPLQSGKTLIATIYRHAAQYFSPCAPVVALVGPDGVGKSSVLNAIKEQSGSVFTKIVIRHWRPGVLPNLGAYVGREHPGQSGAPVAPRRHPGRFKAARQFYYFWDFVIGYYLRDRVNSARQQLVLYDRCALDMAVDPVRYGLASDRGMNLFWRLIPKPDLVIFLCDEPARIHARKAELDLPELQRQIDVWKRFAQSGRVHVTIPVDAPAAEIAERVRRQIMQTFVRKLST